VDKNFVVSGCSMPVCFDRHVGGVAG